MGVHLPTLATTDKSQRDAVEHLVNRRQEENYQSLEFIGPIVTAELTEGNKKREDIRNKP